MGRERGRIQVRGWWRAYLLAVAVALAACGAPGGGPPVDECAVRESVAGDPFFAGRETFSAGAAEGACFVSSERFKELAGQEGFVWAAPSDPAT